MKMNKQDLVGLVKETQYHRFPGTTVTVCCLTLENGYAVVGESACLDPKDFCQTLGETYAFEDAIDQLWALEGYRRKQRREPEEPYQSLLQIEEPAR